MMKILATIAICIVAALHFGFLTLEMFYWDHPIGRKVFSMTPEQSANSAVLAANQGLYNGFLAVGLLWAHFTNRCGTVLFLLGCIVVAGIFGAITAKHTILFTQALPAAIAIALLLAAPKTAAATNDQ